MKISLDIKPLSVNKAWQGRRFKTPEYKAYEQELLLRLPRIEIPKPPYKIYYEFGLSNKLSDIDNCIKQLQDILQKKYEFNDNEIYELHAKKKIVPKGREYIAIEMNNLLL